MYASVHVALVFKVNVSTECHDSQQASEVVLVIFNVRMTAAIVAEISIIAYSVQYVSTRKQEGDITLDFDPRFRRMRWPLDRDVSASQEELERRIVDVLKYLTKHI